MNEQTEKPLPILLTAVQKDIINKMRDGEKIFVSKWCDGPPQLSQSGLTVRNVTFKKFKGEELIELEGVTAAKRIYVLTEKGRTLKIS